MTNDEPFSSFESFESSKITRRRLLRDSAALGLSAPTLAALLAACGGDEEAGTVPTDTFAGDPVRGGQLRVGLASNFEDFDPQRSPFGNYPFIQQLYNPVVRDANQPDASEPLPWLGELRYADDSSYVDVVLNEGITFHSGEALNAQTVIANIEKARDEIKGADTKAAWDPIVGELQEIDEVTARVVFQQPSPPAYVTQLFSLLGIISTSFATGDYDRVKTQADGTGAFRLVSYSMGDRAVLERNENYFREGRPYLDGIEFQFFTDPDAMVAALESGGVHMAVDVPPANLERLNQRNFKIEQGAPALCYEVMMSADRGKPFERKEARQAMQYLVDRERFANDIMFGAGEPAFIHVDPNSIGYDESYENRYRYDPDHARELFQELDMLDKDPIRIMQLQGVLPMFGRLAEMVAGDMNAIGLNAELVPVDFSVLAENVWGSNKGNYEMFTSFMGRGNRYPTFLSQGNIQLNAVENPAFPDSKPPEPYNEAFLNLSTALTPEDQRRWALQMTETILDESWDIAVAYQRTQYAMVQELEGFAVTRDEHPVLEEMFLRT